MHCYSFFYFILLYFFLFIILFFTPFFHSLGEILSKKEFKNLTSIKTLRTKNIEAEKNQMDLQKKYDRLAAEHADNHARVGRLQDENRRLEGRDHILPTITG